MRSSPLSPVATLAWAAAMVGGLAGCAGSRAAAPSAAPSPSLQVEEGLASWYGHPYHGRPAASGLVFDMHGLTAAHRTLPFGSRVRVVNLTNGKAVEVVITDRGPWVEGRILDLSRRAAELLGALEAGVIPVRLEVLTLGEGLPQRACWEVQVGAFADPGHVGRALAALGQLGLAARTATARELTRVRVTGLSSRAEAVSLAARLQGEFPGAMAVPCGDRP